jgi:hypothetical protein
VSRTVGTVSGSVRSQAASARRDAAKERCAFVEAARSRWCVPSARVSTVSMAGT